MKFFMAKIIGMAFFRSENILLHLAAKFVTQTQWVFPHLLENYTWEPLHFCKNWQQRLVSSDVSLWAPILANTNKDLVLLKAISHDFVECQLASLFNNLNKGSNNVDNFFTNMPK